MAPRKEPTTEGATGRWPLLANHRSPKDDSWEFRVREGARQQLEVARSVMPVRLLRDYCWLLARGFVRPSTEEWVLMAMDERRAAGILHGPEPTGEALMAALQPQPSTLREWVEKLDRMATDDGLITDRLASAGVPVVVLAAADGALLASSIESAESELALAQQARQQWDSTLEAVRPRRLVEARDAIGALYRPETWSSPKIRAREANDAYRTLLETTKVEDTDAREAELRASDGTPWRLDLELLALQDGIRLTATYTDPWGSWFEIARRCDGKPLNRSYDCDASCYRQHVEAEYGPIYKQARERHQLA